MKKQIRLLVESLFDDEFNNIYNDTDLDIEIANEYIGNYKVGDIYYKNKKPYAICCGDKNQFKDITPRFCLINSDRLLSWCTDKTLTCINELDSHEYKVRVNGFQPVDENGYENTQIIKNNYNLIYFPAFEYCLNFGDNVYLPAIDELQILFQYQEKINNLFKKFKGINIDVYNTYWSSTQYIKDYGCSLLFDMYNGHILNDFYYYSNNVRPFLYLK